MSAPAIKLDVLVSELKGVRNPSYTRLANRLATAAELRHSRPNRRVYSDGEWNERLGHGYTRGQSMQGGYKNGLNSNRAALIRDFAAAVPKLLEDKWYATIEQLIETLAAYRIDTNRLRKIVEAAEEEILIPLLLNRDFDELDAIAPIISISTISKAAHH